jgi:hypothetical protein
VISREDYISVRVASTKESHKESILLGKLKKKKKGNSSRVIISSASSYPEKGTPYKQHLLEIN